MMSFIPPPCHFLELNKFPCTSHSSRIVHSNPLDILNNIFKQWPKKRKRYPNCPLRRRPIPLPLPTSKQVRSRSLQQRPQLNNPLHQPIQTQPNRARTRLKSKQSPPSYLARHPLLRPSQAMPLLNASHPMNLLMIRLKINACTIT